MKKLLLIALYASLGLGANTLLAQDSDLAALREGSMKKLTFLSEPLELDDVAFVHEDGSEARLSDYAGKHIVLNFLATWCAPCRKEMPYLAEL